jgi:hypothetical protein
MPLMVKMTDDSYRRFVIDGDEEVNNRELEMEDEFSKEAGDIDREDYEGHGTLLSNSLAKTAMKNIRNAEVPSILNISGIDPACCGTKQNTKYRFLTITKYWMVFVQQHEENGVPFEENFGLGLYNPSSSFTVSGGLDSDFHRDRVRKFFLFLQEVGLSASQMDKAKQFINSHPRRELKSHLIAANHQNPYLGNPRVGEAVEVAGIINDVRGQKAR